MSEKLTFIFAHGMAGWGSYDKRYKRLPYWGMHIDNALALNARLAHRHVVGDFYLELLRTVAEAQEKERRTA